jgi:hypothetical protein
MRNPHDIGRDKDVDDRQDQGVDHVGQQQNLHGSWTGEKDVQLTAQGAHAVANLAEASEPATMGSNRNLRALRSMAKDMGISILKQMDCNSTRLVRAGLLADCVGHITSGSRKGSPLLVHAARLRIDALGNNPSIPSACFQNLERMFSSHGER